MSMDTFYIPSMNAVKNESLALYHGLISFIAALPGGPWRYAEGYDPTPNGDWYSFTLTNLYHPEQSVSVTAVKNGGSFSFSVSPGPEH